MIDKLHFISQRNSSTDHIESIHSALESGCKWIQLRVKNETEKTVLSYAIEAKKLCDKYNSKLIINDYAYIAKEISAYGVHLGLQDMSVAEARKIVGKNIIIGGTANTYEDIIQRVNEGANYIGLGPYRFTRTKENLSPILGLKGYIELFKKLKNEKVTIPIIAIGGIELSDIESLVDAGVYGIAVSSLIVSDIDKTKLVKELYSLLDSKEEIVHNSMLSS